MVLGRERLFDTRLLGMVWVGSDTGRIANSKNQEKYIVVNNLPRCVVMCSSLHPWPTAKGYVSGIKLTCRIGLE